MVKQLIINADDYGLNRNVVEAILELAETGAISSTTIMANMVSGPDLLKISKCRNISTGLHFNILEGRPVCSPQQVFSIVDQSGNFLSLNSFISRYMLKKVWLEHVEMELAAQLDVLTENKLQISHADSHKHLHQFPFIGRAIQEMFLRHGIRKVRNCRITDESIAKTALYRGVWEIAKLNNDQFRCPDTLITSFWGHGRSHEELFRNAMLKAFTTNTIAEFMTHPAMHNEPGSLLDRRAEYLFWKSMKWRGVLEEGGIGLYSYHDL